MTTSDYSKAIVATACWRACRGETPQVMLAVAMVFRNRANAGWYDKDLYQNAVAWLVENPGEFPDTRDPVFQKLLSDIELVTLGMLDDRTDGALWFGPKSDDPIQGVVTMTIGNFVFVR